MVPIYYHVHVHSCIRSGVQKKLRFLTRCKQVPRTYVIEKKELDTKTCPTCDKTFSEGEESLWIGFDICPRWYNKKCVHNPRMKKLYGNVPSVKYKVL